MLFGRTNSTDSGYMLSLNLQLLKAETRFMPTVNGIEVQTNVYIGDKKFSELAAIAQECEAFVESLRTKYQIEPTPGDGQHPPRYGESPEMHRRRG